MIRVLCFRLPEVPEQTALNAVLSRLPEDAQERYASYFQQADRLRFLAGRLLLRKGLVLSGLPENQREPDKTAFGKPFFPELPAFHFNISHSGNLVVCACSTHTEIGIDIEQIRAITIGDFRDFIPEDQWKDIFSDRSFSAFYRYWTSLEATLKAIGKGLSLPINALTFHQDFIAAESHRYFIHRMPVDRNYTCALATPEENAQLEFRHLSFGELFSPGRVS